MELQEPNSKRIGWTGFELKSSPVQSNTITEAVLVFTFKIELLLVTILVRILYKISNFRVASFRLGLREVAPSSI